VLGEVDWGGYEFTVDGVTQMSNFGGCLPGEGKGKCQCLSDARELVCGGEIDRHAGVEQKESTGQCLSCGLGQVDDLGRSVLRYVASLSELLVGTAGADYVGA
jgi:hypothetical protein